MPMCGWLDVPELRTGGKRLEVCRNDAQLLSRVQRDVSCRCPGPGVGVPQLDLQPDVTVVLSLTRPANVRHRPLPALCAAEPVGTRRLDRTPGAPASATRRDSRRARSCVRRSAPEPTADGLYALREEGDSSDQKQHEHDNEHSSYQSVAPTRRYRSLLRNSLPRQRASGHVLGLCAYGCQPLLRHGARRVFRPAPPQGLHSAYGIGVLTLERTYFDGVRVLAEERPASRLAHQSIAAVQLGELFSQVKALRIGSDEPPKSLPGHGGATKFQVRPHTRQSLFLAHPPRMARGPPQHQLIPVLDTRAPIAAESTTMVAGGIAAVGAIVLTTGAG